MNQQYGDAGNVGDGDMSNRPIQSRNQQFGGGQDFEPREARTIFVRNLAYGADDVELRAAYKGFANAKDVKIPYDQETGRPRGYAFIEFHTSEECTKVLSEVENMSITVQDRELILAQSQPKEKRSGGGGGGGGRRGVYNQGGGQYSNNNFGGGRGGNRYNGG